MKLILLAELVFAYFLIIKSIKLKKKANGNSTSNPPNTKSNQSVGMIFYIVLSIVIMLIAFIIAIPFLFIDVSSTTFVSMLLLLIIKGTSIN